MRCLRDMPTALAMPISIFRSSASMTKMFTISIIPAIMEKLPSIMKMSCMPELLASALSRLSCLTFDSKRKGIPDRR